MLTHPTSPEFQTGSSSEAATLQLTKNDTSFLYYFIPVIEPKQRSRNTFFFTEIQ